MSKMEQKILNQKDLKQNNWKQKKAKFVEKVKKSFLKWSENTTSHAIPEITKNISKRNLVKAIVWTIAFIGGAFACIYFVIKAGIRYRSHETVITTQVSQEFPAEFPAITICNINPFNEHKAGEYIRLTQQSIDEYSCFKKSTGNEFRECFKSNQTDAILDTFVDKLKRVIANDRSLNQSTRMYYGFDLDDDMLISCSYNSKDCSGVNFTKFWSNIYGNCYTFNDGLSQTVSTTSASGSTYGLKMQLIVRPPDNETVFAYKTGLFVWVHNQSSLPFTLNSGINISPGYETFIGINRVFTTKQSAPYSDCITDLTEPPSDYAKKLFQYFNVLGMKDYDQNFCLTLCYQNELVKRCQCSDIITPALDDSSYCADINQLACMREFSRNFSSANLIDECGGACLQPCKRVEYNLAISSAAFPTMSYLRYLSTDEQFSKFFPKDNSQLQSFAHEAFLKINFYYDNLYYTSIIESPKTDLWEFFGEVGGIAGVYLGWSLLTLLEVILLVFDMIRISYQNFKEYRKKTKLAERLKQQYPIWLHNNQVPYSVNRLHRPSWMNIYGAPYQIRR